MHQKKQLFLNYFKPSIYVRSFMDVNIGQLKLRGMKLFICDLDNTLVPHYIKFPNRKVIDFIKKIQDAGMEFIIVSNNIKKRVKMFSEKINVEWYANARKPFKFVLKKILKAKAYNKSHVIFMGDQIALDILVANRMKINSILVQPLVTTDYKMNKFNIFLEKLIYKRLEVKNILTQGKYMHGNFKTTFELL